MFWVRIGDDGAMEPFGGLDTALEYLNNSEVGTVDRWDRLRFDTPNFHGTDGVMIFWGNRRGNPLRALTRAERATVESRLMEVLN